jgi:hypothetical protein
MIRQHFDPRRMQQRPRPAASRVELTRDERIEQDRRKMCRRIYNVPVMLDTRSGTDRRGESRRDVDIATHITIKA